MPDGASPRIPMSNRCALKTQNSPGTAPAAQQSFPLTDTDALSIAGGTAESVEYLGRKGSVFTTQAYSDIFAYVNGSPIQNGVIEVDIAVKITTPPGEQNHVFHQKGHVPKTIDGNPPPRDT
jgi:hypothetical protein